MKYYAVTDDPTELMHYGIKGMKWGIIRTDAQLGHPRQLKVRRTPKAKEPTKPRSPAYMKASAKLSSAMQRGIAKAQANWREYNSPENKAERKYQRHLQKAREGKLKYKNVSDDEVYRITDRLAIERSSRALSGSEATFRGRLKDSVQEGIIRGAGQGTANYINERMTGRGRTAAKIQDEKRMAAYHNSLQGRLAANRENRAASRKAKAEAKREVDKEQYKTLAESGEHGRVYNLLSGAKMFYDRGQAMEKARLQGLSEEEVNAIGESYDSDLIKERLSLGLGSRRTRAQVIKRIKDRKDANAEAEAQEKAYNTSYYGALGKYYGSRGMPINSASETITNNHPPQPANGTRGGASSVVRDSVRNSSSRTPESNVQQMTIPLDDLMRQPSGRHDYTVRRGMDLSTYSRGKRRRAHTRG